jgi:hypothetical protein
MEAEATQTVSGADRVGMGTSNEFSRLRDECATQLQRTREHRLAPPRAKTKGAPCLLLHPHDYGLIAISTVVIGFVSLFSEPGLAAGPVQTHVLSEETSPR